MDNSLSNLNSMGFRFPAAFAATVLSAHLVLLSCEIAEPDLTRLNTPAAPSVYVDMNGSLIPTGHLTGVISFRVPDSLSPPAVRLVEVYFDSVILLHSAQAGENVDIDLRQRTPGWHAVVLAVYDSVGYEGLLGLLDVPTRVYEFPLFVDHTPPTVVQNVQMEWQAAPAVTWSPSPDSNFYAYIVRRHPSGTPSPATFVDTLFDRGQTSFSDDNGPLPWYGNIASYSIGTWNREAVVYTSLVTIYHGTPFPVAGTVHLLENPTAPEIYVVTGYRELHAVSTVTHQGLRKIPLDQGLLLGSDKSLEISEDGSKLFHAWVDHSDTSIIVRVYDTSTFAVVTEWEPGFEFHMFLPMAAGKGNTLYGIDTAGVLLEIDGMTGMVLNSIGPIATEYQVVLESTPDRNHLLMSESSWQNGYSSKVTRIDIGSGPSQVIQSRSFSTNVIQVLTDSAFSTIGVVHGIPTPEHFEFIDPTTFSTTSIVNPPPEFIPGSLAYESVLWQDRLYVSYQVAVGHGRVSEMDISSVTVLRRWDFREFPRNLHRIRSGAVLYGLNAWIPNAVSDWIIPL